METHQIQFAGASDCAACVAVALEVARTFVQNPGLALPAPITFLLNGGEEPILPAAHGFITQSSFVKDLGAFINLESTGPGGPDVIFQYSGTSCLRRGDSHAVARPASGTGTGGQTMHWEGA